jgi:hypothetical protein
VPLSFDTRTGVANSDLGVATIRRRLGCDADVAFECELKGIRDEIEHHLLPHVGVDVDLVRQRWAIDNQYVTPASFNAHLVPDLRANRPCGFQVSDYAKRKNTRLAGKVSSHF